MKTIAKGIAKSTINLSFIFAANVTEAQARVNKLQTIEKTNAFLLFFESTINKNQKTIYVIVVMMPSKLESCPMRKELKFIIMDSKVTKIKAKFRYLDFIYNPPII